MFNELNRNYNIDALHIEIQHPLEDITLAKGKAMGLKLSGMCKSCKAFVLEKTKRLE